MRYIPGFCINFKSKEAEVPRILPKDNIPLEAQNVFTCGIVLVSIRIREISM